MRLLYVAGKLADSTAWKRELNIRQAEEVALQLMKMGFAVFVPHTQCRSYDGELPWEAWIERDLEVLCRCNAVFMLPNWKDSKGATAEHEQAKKLGMKILYSLEEAAAYLKEEYPYDHLG